MIMKLAQTAFLGIVLNVAGPGATVPADPATPPGCQTVTFAFDSGNGAQVTGTICGGIAKPRCGCGQWIFYVDGENTIVPKFLIFGKHITG